MTRLVGLVRPIIAHSPLLMRMPAVCISAIAIWAVVPSFAAAAGETNVKAVYRISFAGVKIGFFNFVSKIDGKRYDLTSGSKAELLFGAWKWSSKSRSQGTIGRSISPQTFEFDYKIKKKRKRAEIGFSGGRVVKLVNTPPVRYSPKHVALTKMHLIDVLDPMSAIMQMTRANNGEPCRDTLEVFDGKMRLRLQLSPGGKRRISEKNRSGQPAFGYVCRVKFTPVAGHKKDSQINYIANNDGIKIVLRPVPSAKILVPYRIEIPTMIGSVVMAAKSIVIVNEDNQRIAMKH